MARMAPEQLKARLDNLTIKLIPAAADGMAKAVLNIEARARLNCTPGSSPYESAGKLRGAPFDTGHLRANIKHDTQITGRTVTGLVGDPVEYAEAVHEGTSRMQGRPFILDAIVSERDTTIDLLSAALSDALEDT